MALAEAGRGDDEMIELGGQHGRERRYMIYPAAIAAKSGSR